MPFTILDQDRDTIEALMATPIGALTVICRVSLHGERVVLYDLHVHGPGPSTLDLTALRGIVREVMEQLDVDTHEIQGFARTTGAGPGYIPSALIFRRR